MKIITACVIIAIITGLLINSFVETTQSSELDGFEVHEWGVFLKGYDCNDTAVETYLPEITVLPKKPAIYFHSSENLTNVSVNVSNIVNTTVIPNATIGNNWILWYIAIENNLINMPDGTNYTYLFYEGEITYHPTIIANITINGTDATFYVKNHANYSIYDLFFIYGEFKDVELPVSVKTVPPPSTLEYFINYIYIDEINAKEEKIITTTLQYPDIEKNGIIQSAYNLSEDINNLLSNLIVYGLTETEAQELIDYWKDFWFNPYKYSDFTILPPPQARLFYTIPQSVYDQLLPLQVTPQPNAIKRVGIFTITDIPIMQIDTEDQDIGKTPGYEFFFVIYAIAIILFIKRKQMS